MRINSTGRVHCQVRQETASVNREASVVMADVWLERRRSFFPCNVHPSFATAIRRTRPDQPCVGHISTYSSTGSLQEMWQLVHQATYYQLYANCWQRIS